jgi:translation initiation factor eIF-2B subunit epsilon
MGEAKKKAPAKPSQQQDLKTEEVLQALILADSFDQRFTPITLEKPRVTLTQQTQTHQHYQHQTRHY